MKKAIFTNLKSFDYVSEHKGAHYTFDGVHFMNTGEMSEAQLKFCFGFEAEKDANTAFDCGSDIEQYNMSVKSGKATLTSEILGKDMETSLNCYFERTASSVWAWVIMVDGTLTTYIMNKAEFENFTKTWANFQKDGHIRYKATSGKMIEWLEGNL